MEVLNKKGVLLPVYLYLKNINQVFECKKQYKND